MSESAETENEMLIALRGIRLAVAIGVSEQERARTRPIELDVEWVVRPANSTAGEPPDDVSHTVDYAAVHRTVVEVAKSGPYRLIETMACRIRAEILRRFPSVLAVRVRCTKPAPPLSGDVRSAEVVVPPALSESWR